MNEKAVKEILDRCMTVTNKPTDSITKKKKKWAD